MYECFKTFNSLLIFFLYNISAFTCVDNMMCDYGPQPFLFNINEKVPFAFGAEIEMNPHKFLHHFLAIVKCATVFSLIHNTFLYRTIIN